MATTSQLQARITELEDRMATFAGVKSTQIENQSTTFDLEGAQQELTRLRGELALALSSAGTRTRYAATSKGV